MGFFSDRYGLDNRSPIKPRYDLKPGEFAKYSSLEREAWASELLEHAIYLIASQAPRKKRAAQATVRGFLDTYKGQDGEGAAALPGLARALAFFDQWTRPVAPGPKRIVPLNEFLKSRNKPPRGRRSNRTYEEDLNLLEEFEAEKNRQRAESAKRSQQIGAEWARRMLRSAYESLPGSQGLTAQQVRLIKTRAPALGREVAVDIKRARARIRTKKRRLRRQSVTKPNS